MPTEEAAPTEEVMPTEGAAPPVTTTGTVTPTLQPVTALTVTSTATVTTTVAVTKTPMAAIITSTVTVTATAEVTASLSALTATQAFTSDAWGISSMSYPAAWTTSTQGETSTIFAEDLALFDAGDFSSAGAARLTVLNRKQALAGTNLRDVMAKEAAKAWKLSALPDVKKAKAVKLGGKTALELQANAQLADGGAVKTWNRIALVGDNVVIISAIAPAQASSQYETLFANLFNSVKFVK